MKRYPVPKKLPRGSALIFVLSVTTVLSFLTLACWVKISLAYDLLRERERYYKNFYMTESGLTIAIGLVRANIGTFYDNNMRAKLPLKVDVTSMLASNAIFLEQLLFDQKKLTIVIKIDNPIAKNKGDQKNRSDQLMVHAFLMQDTACRCHLSCMLVKIPIAQSDQNNKKGFTLVVQHFTISSLL